LELTTCSEISTYIGNKFIIDLPHIYDQDLERVLIALTCTSIVERDIFNLNRKKKQEGNYPIYSTI